MKPRVQWEPRSLGGCGNQSPRDGPPPFLRVLAFRHQSSQKSHRPGSFAMPLVETGIEAAVGTICLDHFESATRSARPLPKT